MNAAKMKITALEDQVQAELTYLNSLADGAAQLCEKLMRMQAELGKAIERVGQQQRRLGELADQCEASY